jgi:hypothetical protein
MLRKSSPPTVPLLADAPPGPQRTPVQRTVAASARLPHGRARRHSRGTSPSDRCQRRNSSVPPLSSRSMSKPARPRGLSPSPSWPALPRRRIARCRPQALAPRAAPAAASRRRNLEAHRQPRMRSRRGSGRAAGRNSRARRSARRRRGRRQRQRRTRDRSSPGRRRAQRAEAGFDESAPRGAGVAAIPSGAVRIHRIHVARAGRHASRWRASGRQPSTGTSSRFQRPALPPWKTYETAIGF